MHVDGDPTREKPAGLASIRRTYRKKQLSRHEVNGRTEERQPCCRNRSNGRTLHMELPAGEAQVLQPPPPETQGLPGTVTTLGTILHT